MPGVGGAIGVPSGDEKRLARWCLEIVRLRIRLVDLPIEKQRELWTARSIAGKRWH